MSEYHEWISALGALRPFGSRDRLGTANYIDQSARRRAASSVHSGQCLPLARPLVDSAVGEESEHDYLLDVSVVEGRVGWATENLQLRCHGPANTHIDALNHISVGGQFYGGHQIGDPDLSTMVDLARHGLFTRGIIADIPASRGTDWVTPDRPVTADDIERSLGDTSFESGDALLLYMGRDRFEASGEAFPANLSPGPGRSAAQWMVDNHVSILCWDFFDAAHPGEPQLSVHRLIWAIGLVIVDNCELSSAAAASRAGGRRTGALAVSPIAVPGGTGCSVTPLLVI